MTTYTTYETQAAGNKWVVMVAEGNSNYISVRKATNNPFGMLGKDFANFEAAIANYKLPELKSFLLLVSLGMAQQTAVFN
jgi:hypothetical protein